MLNLNFNKTFLSAVFDKIIVLSQLFQSFKWKSIQIITVLPGQVEEVEEGVLEITTDLNEDILNIGNLSPFCMTLLSFLYSLLCQKWLSSYWKKSVLLFPSYLLCKKEEAVLVGDISEKRSIA